MTKARSLADLMADGNSLSDGVVSVAEVSGAAPLASPSFTGDISVTGTVDGRDVSADGTKLDGIEAGATADQTKADIDALNVDADTLDGKQLATIESEYQAFANTAANTAAANVVDSAPGTLDTLNELAAALGDDANFSTTVTNSIATKMPLAGGTFTGAISGTSATFDGGVDIDNINIDGTTIALSSGNLTLDVAGHISLDAAASDIKFLDGGTEYGRVYKQPSANMAFYTLQQDADMLFQGNDGGSTITALTLDMSAAGKANFNAGASFQDHVYFGDNDKAVFGASDDLQIFHDGNSKIQDVGAGNLEITTNGIIKLQKGNTEYMAQFNVDGAVQLYYDNSAKLATSSSGITVTGDANAANFNTTSDATLKTNVETLSGSLDAVTSLRGVSFDWLENGGSEIGVIAQEVEAVLPDVVSTNDEGIKSVKYGNIVAVLIEAIKEQQLRIEALEAQLNS